MYRLFLIGWLALLGWTQYTGGSGTSVETLDDVPKDVRRNPTAYRSFYTGSGFRGK